MKPQKKKPATKTASNTAPAGRIMTGRVTKASARVTAAVAPPPSTSTRRSSRIAAAKITTAEAAVEAPETAKVAEVDAPAAVPKRGRSKKAAANSAPDAGQANARAAVPKSHRTKKAVDNNAEDVESSNVPAAATKQGRTRKVASTSSANVESNGTRVAVSKKGRSKKAAPTSTSTPVVDHADVPAQVTRMTRSKTLASTSAPDVAPAAPSRAKKPSQKAAAEGGPSGPKKSKASTSKATEGASKSTATTPTAPAKVPRAGKSATKAATAPKPSGASRAGNSKKSPASAQQHPAGDRRLTPEELDGSVEDLFEKVEDSRVEGSANAESSRNSSTSTAGASTSKGKDAASTRQQTPFFETHTGEELQRVEGDDEIMEPAVPVAQTPSAKSLGKRPVRSNPSPEEGSVDSEVDGTVPATQIPPAQSLGKRLRNPYWSPGDGPLNKRTRLERGTPRPPITCRYANGPEIRDYTPTRCIHRIHPAYANTPRYDNVKCPYCRMDVCITDMQNIQDQLSIFGGSVPFRRLCDRFVYGYACEFQPLVNGQTRNKRKTFVIQDPVGKDLSYRHATERLANLVMELERLLEWETQWEQQHPTGSVEDRHERQLYGATAALSRYRGLLATGSFSRVLQLDLVACRKRGRAEEVEVLDYYDEQNEEAVAWEADFLGPGEYVSRDSEGASEWVSHDSEVPSTQETDNLAAERLRQPKRKRRRMGATVTFNNVVHMRTENDVDVLRKADLSRPVVAPPASILRTAPPPSEVVSVPTAQRPETEYATLPLQDKDSVHNRPSFCHRGPDRDEPSGNFWSELMEPGKMIVETSGYRVDPGDWALYAQDLREEARRWDAKDARDALMREREGEASRANAESGPSNRGPTSTFSYAPDPSRLRYVSLLTGAEVVDPVAYLAAEEERLARQPRYMDGQSEPSAEALEVGVRRQCERVTLSKTVHDNSCNTLPGVPDTMIEEEANDDTENDKKTSA